MNELWYVPTMQYKVAIKINKLALTCQLGKAQNFEGE